MPYTLAKFFLWGLLMALAGGIVGWMLRSLKCRAEVARARAITIDEVELDRLRGRLANLEPVVAERDRLRMELADVRGSSAGALGFSSTVQASIIPTHTDDPVLDDVVVDSASVASDPTPEPIAAFASTGGDEAEQPGGDGSDGPPADEAGAARNSVLDDMGTANSNAGDPAGDPVGDPVGDESAPAELDLAGAATVLGKKIKLDDLTAIEGIGPKIAELCNAIGVTSWGQLAATDVDDLQSMLDAAGSRFQMHKPATWPQQAGLLATGKWAAFKELTDSLTAGK